MRENAGSLVMNRDKVRGGTDADVIGTLRLPGGRIIRLRGWIEESEGGACIRLAAAQDPAP